MCALLLLGLAVAQEVPEEPWQALRILRQKERQGDLQAIRRLGRTWETALPRWDQRDHSTREVLACLAEHGELEFLRRLVASLPDGPGRAQIARRVAGSWGSLPPASARWLNLPRGALALPAAGATCLASDDRFVYAGASWGLAVYAHDLTPRARVALGRGVLDLEALGGFVWAATGEGLLRIDPDTGQVRRIALEPGSMQDLFRQGELLWVLTDQHLQR
ncbi:hypothetical protein DYH09_35225, partial [bacterium CPR1]|nr:hypothetical protein [bacterium CPR1]